MAPTIACSPDDALIQHYEIEEHRYSTADFHHIALVSPMLSAGDNIEAVHTPDAVYYRSVGNRRVCAAL